MESIVVTMKKLIVETLRLIWFGSIMLIAGVGIIWADEDHHNLTPRAMLTLFALYLMAGLIAYLVSWMAKYLTRDYGFEFKAFMFVLCLVTGPLALLGTIGAIGMDKLHHLERKLVR
jgi:hypothetical protein